MYNSYWYPKQHQWKIDGGNDEDFSGDRRNLERREYVHCILPRIGYCPELDIASCGTDTEEARKNLIEVIEIQLEETEKLGTLKAFLEGTKV